MLDTDDYGAQVLETSHPPSYYLPRAEFRVPLLASSQVTVCEWKVETRYIDLDIPGVGLLREVGWWYPQPDLCYPQLTDRAAVYAGRFDAVSVDGETVMPQPGEFYGGWITADAVGPVKGVPGSWGW